MRYPCFARTPSEISSTRFTLLACAFFGDREGRLKVGKRKAFGEREIRENSLRFWVWNKLVRNGASVGAPIAGALSVVLLSACVPAPNEFLGLCDEHNGLKMYRDIEPVEGFVEHGEAIGNEEVRGCGANCKHWLTGGIWGDSVPRYKFIEAVVPHDVFIDMYQDGLNDYRRYLVNRPGIYRFTLEEIGHPNCTLFEIAYRREFQKWGKRPQEFEAACVATWPVDELSARYVRSNYEIYRERSYGALRTLGTLIIDRDNGEIVADERRHVINYKRRPGGPICPEDTLLPGRSPYDVLRVAD